MPPDVFHSNEWNYLILPLINLVCIVLLTLNAAERGRERDRWRREAQRLQAVIEQLAREQHA